MFLYSGLFVYSYRSFLVFFYRLCRFRRERWACGAVCIFVCTVG